MRVGRGARVGEATRATYNDGTYLFTNRQGQKALSMSAEELAERFRSDLARLVEAEPLIDRALSSVIASFGDKFPEPAAA